MRVRKAREQRDIGVFCGGFQWGVHAIQNSSWCFIIEIRNEFPLRTGCSWDSYLGVIDYSTGSSEIQWSKKIAKKKFPWHQWKPMPCFTNFVKWIGTLPKEYQLPVIISKQFRHLILDRLTPTACLESTRRKFSDFKLATVIYTYIHTQSKNQTRQTVPAVHRKNCLTFYYALSNIWTARSTIKQKTRQFNAPSNSRSY